VSLESDTNLIIGFTDSGDAHQLTPESDTADEALDSKYFISS